MGGALLLRCRAAVDDSAAAAAVDCAHAAAPCSCSREAAVARSMAGAEVMGHQLMGAEGCERGEHD
jgi:hypothetical protein